MLLIKNCKVLVNGVFIERSVLIEDGRIREISAPSSIKSSDEVIDARGKYLLPGMVDVHVHCREPGMTEKEDFRTASMAAAAGGVTTIIDMPNNAPPTTSIYALEEKRALASRKCIVNYGFDFGATSGNIESVRSARNIGAVKVFMGSSTGSLVVDSYDDLDLVFSSRRLVAVHAESEKVIRMNEALLRSDGGGGSALHLKVRPPEAAFTEVSRAIDIASRRGTRLHICHLSTGAEAEVVRSSKHIIPLSCEVSPHHLFLNAESASELGNLAKVNPPLRGKKDVAALWEAVGEGVIDMVASDHAPHLLSEKEAGYWNAPSGVPGLETTLPLLVDAVCRERLSLQQLVRLCCFNPASVFRIQGKGSVERGFDADLVLVDLKGRKRIKNDELLTKCGWSPFSGRELEGRICATVVNGHVVYDESGVYAENRGREVVFG